MTQDSNFLNFLEKVCRSNIYLFLISRFIIGKYFNKFIYDKDFEIIKILEKKNYFNKRKIILDIGANDGMSYNIIRKFTKKTKIVSFEPNRYYYKNFKKIQKEDRLFEYKNIALSNSNKKKEFYTPYFKKYALTQIAGINRKSLYERLKKSFFIKDILKKIYLKKKILKTKKIDQYKYNTSFIKIDIEGHELECIEGGIQTIKKFKPILMIEYNKRILPRIYRLIKKFNYKIFFYNKANKKIEKFTNQEVLNIFFIDKKKFNQYLK